MKRQKIKKKIRKLLLVLSIFTIFLSNLSFIVPAKRMHAEELNNDNPSVNQEEGSTTEQKSDESVNEGDSDISNLVEETESQSTEATNDTSQAEEEPVPAESTTPVGETTQATESPEDAEIETPSATEEATSAVDYNLLPSLLITEIMPNNDGADDYEYFEVYNNSNKAIVLDHYTFSLRYTDGSNTDKNMVFSPVTLNPKETVVFWNNVSNKAIVDFNSHYQTNLNQENIVIYSGVPSFYNSGNRAVVISDSLGHEIVWAKYLLEDIGSGQVVQYQYPAEGIEMSKYAVKAAPTPGVIADEQVPVEEVTIADNQAPVIEHTPVQEAGNDEDLLIKANITDDQTNFSAKLYYRNASGAGYEVLDMAHSSGQTYEGVIPKEALIDKISYYLSVTDPNNRVFYPETIENPIEITINEVVEEDFNRYSQLLITEISPNSNGGGTDFYEYFELYNNTNQPLSLMNYSFIYTYTDTGVEKAFQVPSATINPQETLVFWFNNGDRLLSDFNTNFGLNLSSEQVVEFKDVFPGFANGGNRAIVIKDNTGTEVISASYLGNENDNTGAVIQYNVPAAGSEMEKFQILAAPTPGRIDPAQVPKTPVTIEEAPADTTAPEINHTQITNSIAYSPIKVEAKVTDDQAVPFATLFYKAEGAETFTSLSMSASAENLSSYLAEIPGSAVQSNMVYYIEATDGIQSVKTAEYKITVETTAIDYNKVPQFLVTEIVPDSSNVGSADGYEFVEIYNNTNKAINFKDYKIQYRYGMDSASDVIWASVPDDVVIPSRATLVFWIINSQNREKTVADFNANYSTNLIDNEDIVRIYSDGMANGSTRGLVVATNTKKEIAVSYYNEVPNVDDTQPNMGIVYKYPEDGSTQLVKMSAGIQDATPGAVESFQVPNQPVQLEGDTENPSIENMTAVSEVNQKENIHIVADASDNMEVKSVRLFYRTNDQVVYNEAILAEDFDDMMYHHTIYSPDIIAKEYIEYYFVVSDGTNEVTSETFKISIESGLNDSSLRLNVKNGDILAGEKILKGTSKFDSPDNVKLFIDSQEMMEDTYHSLEHTAYFAFEVSGINTFFQNGVTMGDEILHIFDDWIAEWDTITVPIDADRLILGENTITIRAGNKASPFQLDESEENRDDYNLRNVRLVLPNGTILRDPAHSDPSKVYDMGDDGTYRPFEHFQFTITEDHTPSKTYKWDTTSVSDGEHVVIAQNGDEEITTTVLVDNTAPVIETSIIEGKEYKGNFAIDAEVTDQIAGIHTIQVKLDDKEISTPYETSSSQLSPGEHQLSVTAVDIVGNKAEKVVNFSVVNENPEKPELISPTDGSLTPVDGDPILKVKVTDPTDDEVDVTFYKGFTYDASQTNDVKAYKNASDTEPPQTMVPEGETAFAAEDISSVAKIDGNYLTTDSSTQFPYHRFDVTVDSSVDEKDVVELVWNGKSLEGRKVSMYAWNHLTNKWSMIEYKIAGTEDFELTGKVSVNEFVKDSKINVLIQDEIPSSPDEYDYTFIWMSDTQYYSESYPHIFERQTNWIAEKQEELKIKYVFHTGDIVDEADQEYQWVYADEYMSVLDDNEIPYGVLAGNHDVDHKTNDYTEFSKWFGEERFKDKPYYGESYKNNRGHYDLISAKGNDYIMVYMGWGIQDEDIEWISDVLKQYPNRKAILNFHEYMLVSGNRSPLGNRIYNQVVLPNENVVAVLSGHYHDSETLIDAVDDNGDGNPDREIYQMLGDYQGGPEGGQGYMKLLHFDQDNNRIVVNTYSPYLDDYNFYDPATYPGKDEMIINLNLQPEEKRVATDYFAVNIYTDTEIGRIDNMASGSIAEVTWSGLAENSINSWYAVAEDDYTGKAISDIWTFTKGTNETPMPDPVDSEEPSKDEDLTNNEHTNGPDEQENQTQLPSENNNNEQVLDSREKATEENQTRKIDKGIGEKLPVTATNMFQYLFTGILCIIAGAIMMIVKRRLTV